MSETLSKRISGIYRRQWQQAALLYQDQTLTFGELDLRAERLKAAIAKKIAGKQSALLHLPLKRDSSLVVAMLAGIKGGWGVKWYPDPQSFKESMSHLRTGDVVCTYGSDIRHIAEAACVAVDDHGEQFSPEPLHAEGLQDAATSFSVFFPGGPSMPEGVIIHALQQLDQQLTPGEGDCILLVDKSEPTTFLIDLLWCLWSGTVIRLHNGDLPDGNTGSVHRIGMDFSVFFFGGYPKELHFSEKYRLVLDAVRFADQNGFKAIWTPERHFNEFGGLFPNPSVLGAALATVTEKVQIRSGSVVSTLHNSIRLAEDWAVVDNLSGGRVAVSFASGWQKNDFVFFPDRYHDRHAVMLDQVEEVQKLWRGETITTRGVDGQEVPLQIFPEPVQGELPVWITCSGSENTFRDAGSKGAHLLTHMFWQGEDELRQKIEIYRDALARHGYEPRSRKVAVMLHTYLGPDKEEVYKQVESPMKDYLRSSIHLLEAMLSKPRNEGEGPMSVGKYKMNWEKVPDHIMEELLDLAFERFVERASLLGDLDHARRMVRELKQAGVDEIACLIDFGLPIDKVMQGLDHLAELNREFSPLNGSHRVTLMEALPEMWEGDSPWREMANGARHCLLDRSLADVPASLPSNVWLRHCAFGHTVTGAAVIKIDLSKPEKKGFHHAGLKHAGDLLSDDF